MTASKKNRFDHVKNATQGSHEAIYAKNWKQVLLFDALMGIGCILVGFVLFVQWNAFVGFIVFICGIFYVMLVAKRAGRWAKQRNEAGLK